MPQIRLDVDWLTHPKTLSVSPLAQLLFVRSLIYCVKHLTDGHLKQNASKHLALDLAQYEIVTAKVGGGLATVSNNLRPEWLVDELVKAGMWEETESGYYVHDFLDYHHSKAYVTELIESKKIAGQKGGKAKAKQNGKQNSSRVLAEAKQNGSKAVAKVYPDTYTDTRSSLSSSSSSSSLSLIPKDSGIKVDDILHLWNVTFGLKTVGKVGGDILRRLKARAAEHPDHGWWEALFQRVKDSDFLAGRKTDFVATLDWVLGPKNLAKIEAGNYDNRATKPNDPMLDSMAAFLKRGEVQV